MGEKANTSHLLDTVEKGQDKVPNDTAIQNTGMEGTRTGQLPKRDMEGGTYAEPNP